MRRNTFILLAFLPFQLFSQSRWSDWITLYEEGYDRVQISFKVNGCSNSSTPNVINSYWRINNTFSKPRAYVKGKFDYEFCTGGVKTESFTISLEKPKTDGDDGDWGKLFLGAKKVIRVYDYKFYDYSVANTTDKPNASDSQRPANNQYDADENVRLAEKERQERETERLRLEAEETARIEREKQQAFQQRIDNANTEQQQRQEESAAAASELVTGMGAFGAFMFKNIGPEYDKPKNKFSAGAPRFSLNIGYSLAVLPIYENRTGSISTLNSTTQFEETVEENIYTANLDLGLQFWPYYSKHFGLAIIGNGHGGLMPIAGSSLSYSYDYGIKAFIGSWPIKLALSYQWGDRGFSYSHSFSSGAANTLGETISVGEGATKFSRFSIGPRISFNTISSIGNLELIYFTEFYPNMKKISASGFAVNYYSHNRLRFFGEIILNGARMGAIKYELDNGVKNTGNHYKVGVVRTMDWFGQKK